MVWLLVSFATDDKVQPGPPWLSKDIEDKSSINIAPFPEDKGAEDGCKVYHRVNLSEDSRCQSLCRSTHGLALRCTGPWGSGICLCRAS